MEDAGRLDHRGPKAARVHGAGAGATGSLLGSPTTRGGREGMQSSQAPDAQQQPSPSPSAPTTAPAESAAAPEPGQHATSGPQAPPGDTPTHTGTPPAASDSAPATTARGVSQAGRPGRTPGPPPPGHHRDVAGGWLRPAVFGAMDGLVTNVSLISGVGAGGGSSHALALTGVAGLVAGAFSMATGEYVSVTSQNELVAREVEAERRELARNPIGEQAELAEALRAQGVERALAEQVARQISARPDRGLGLHVREELGVDHEDLPSPYTAAGASFAAFTVGALVPLLPYLVGAANLPFALGLSAVAALAGGGAVGRLTARPVWRGAVRQLLLGALAAGATFLIGLAVGTSVG